MQKAQEIIPVTFTPPNSIRLSIEAMTISQLRERAPSDHFTKLQRADFYRLIGVTQGSTNFMVDFSDYPIKALDWLVIRPGQVMRYDFSQQWEGWMLVFRPEALFNTERHHRANEIHLMSQIENLSGLHSLQNPQHIWMTDCLQQMQQDCAMVHEVRDELLRFQLSSIVLRLAMWQAPEHATAIALKGSVLEKFKRFHQKLETDFAQHHQVQHYAKAIGMSEKNLSRICLAAVGMPAKTYINQRLILESKRLLAHTTIAVQEIAAELGFNDTSNFVKVFKRETGMTPIACRQLYANRTT